MIVIVVVVDPTNLSLKIGAGSDIDDIEFVRWWFTVIFMSIPTFELSLG